MFFLSKDTSPNCEYEWRIGTTDLMELIVLLPDASHLALRASNAAVTMGSWRLYSATYSAATGGATAANDMTLYENGAVIASTATNDALYTTMTNGTAVLEAGSAASGTTRFMQGQMAFEMLCAGNLPVATHLAVLQACRAYYGVPL